MTDERYQGWKNYETWAVALHINNDQPTQDYWHEAAREAIETAQPTEVWTADEAARYGLEDLLKDHHETGAADTIEAAGAECGVFADLLNSALENVSWEEVAANLLEAVAAPAE
jgi:hypothetical protein